MEFPKITGIRLPSIRQLGNDASNMFSRALQYTEEKLGGAEKTEYDVHFENLFIRFNQTRFWAEQLKKQTEIVLQPNPNFRMEDFVYIKMDRKPPDRLSNSSQLGSMMVEAGNEIGSETPYGEALRKCGEVQIKLGQTEQVFIQKTAQNYLQPLHNFLESDCKTIQKEKNVLEKKRLDLDACKKRLKKASTLETRQSTENNLQSFQMDFDKQKLITQLLLQGIGSSQAHQLRSLREFVDAQTEYFAKCYEHLRSFQDQLKRSEPSPTLGRDHNKLSSVPIGTTTEVSYGSNLTPQPKQARVLYDYDASDRDELSLLADEIIYVYAEPGLSKDWMIGRRGTSTGKVPVIYIDILE